MLEFPHLLPQSDGVILIFVAAFANFNISVSGEMSRK